MSIKSDMEAGILPTLADFDLYNCPLCDGVTPAKECNECWMDHCEFCLDAYGCEGCE